MTRQECYLCSYRWSAKYPLTECPKCYSREVGPELERKIPEVAK